MNRRSSERLAELIDNPDLHPAWSAENRDLARLAGISRQLSAVQRVEPDPRFTAGLRAVLMATVTREDLTGRCAERRIGWPFRPRLRLWVIAVLTGGVLAGAGMSFASDSVDRPWVSPTDGPLVPTATPASSGGGDGGRSGGPGPGRPSAAPGADQPATSGSPGGGVVGPSADPSASHEQSPPGPSPSPADGGLVGDLVDLIGSLPP